MCSTGGGSSFSAFSPLFRSTCRSLASKPKLYFLLFFGCLLFEARKLILQHFVLAVSALLS
jgi:hypothetical protein